MFEGKGSRSTIGSVNGNHFVHFIQIHLEESVFFC